MIREGSVIVWECVLLASLQVGGNIHGILSPASKVMPLVDNAQPGYCDALPRVNEGDGTLPEELFRILYDAVPRRPKFLFRLRPERRLAESPLNETY